MGLELGVLLADASLFPLALEAIWALSEEPEDASLFLMDDAVTCAPGKLEQLLALGVEVTMCATDAEAHGVRPVDGGARFGSQHDHATMVRDAARVLALTGARRDRARLDDHRPPATGGRRTVLIRLTRDATHPKTAQALRTAVGYAACDLDVVVLAEPPARALVDGTGHPAPILRALGTLRGLGHSIVDAAFAPPDIAVEVTW